MDEEKSEEKPEEKSEEKPVEKEEKKEAPQKHEHQHEKLKKDNLTNKMRENPWIISTLVLVILLLIFLISNFAGTGWTITGKTISESDAGEKVLDFVKSQTSGQGELVEVNDFNDAFYEVVILFQGNNIPVYITKDGEYFTSTLVSMDLATQAVEQEAPDTQETETTPIDVSIDDDAIKGDPDAPVTIIEFSDYECPFCGKYFEQTLPQIVSEYVDTGKVRLVFRDFPLGFHQDAQKAGEAAECAGEQGKYWEMHDKLFENQNALDVDSLKSYAKEIGLNTAEFNTCLDSDEMADEVKADMADGQSYGVKGTPAFFINGRFLSGAQPFSAFEKIIEEELAKVEA